MGVGSNVTVLVTVNTWVRVDRAVTPSSSTTGNTAVLRVKYSLIFFCMKIVRLPG